ncbi:nitroreductase [Kribbella sp. ALI-6-A]|uniref:nitroreductase family deazaflavin-dependent oxidoreductase n=1 Tax=Kribbella sp. ALI-6-A TaxID=1933817 RepID=UPI00097C7AE1|nr:nitroreductase family deazaflavin-dependent oxidoreductase [Kribbella sp. ALI-6-A]ONI74114.1 nitroreductase [Kribbella sp. ALI-6-A]
MPLEGEYIPSTFTYARDQADLIESSGGTQGLELGGRPVIVLTSVGAKSGALRKNVLMRVEHEGQYAVVGSRGGKPQNPDWVYNLRKHPQVELQDGPEKHDYTAQELAGAERDLWWDRAVTAYPDYAEYPTRTTRVIPVFLLTRTEP